MASDVQKTVEFVLKLSGVDPKSLTPLVDEFKKLDTQIKNTQKSIGKFQTALKNLKPPASFKNLANEFEKLNKVKLKDLGPLASNLQKISKIQSMPNIGTFVNNVTKLSGVSLSGFKALSDSFREISKLKIDSVVSKIRDLNTALSTLEKKGGLSTFARFATDVRAMRSALDSSQASINRINDSMSQISNSVDTAGIKMRTFGDKVRTVLEFRVISEGIIQLREAITSGFSAIVSYDQALKDLQAITGATSTEVAQMGEKILEVASTTKFSAEEVAAGMRTLGQAGFAASEAVLTMQSVADLSTGTLSDMAQTVDLVTTAMRVFQIDASRSQEVVDTFANAVNRSKLTIEKLRTAMNYVGPIAKDANITFQELSAAMMTLANSGIRASTIGTSLRQVFSQLVDPSEKFQKAASEAGVAMQDLDPTTKSLSSVLANLRLVLKDTGTAFDIFGKRGASAALALTTSGSQYNELLSTVSRTGTAAEMAAKQIEGLGLSFKNLRDKLGNLAIVLGKGGIAEFLRLFVNVAREAVDVLTILAETTLGKIIIQLGTFITVIGLATGVFIGLKSAIAGSALAVFATTVATTTKAIWASVTATTAWTAALKANPAVFIFSGIATVIASLIVYVNNLVQKNKELLQETSILANEYGILRKKIQDYQIAVVNLSEGSDELKNKNLALRKELLNTAKNNSVLAESATKVAESIDPLTGAFQKSSEILKVFQQDLQNIQFEKLKQASNDAAENLQNDSNKILSAYRKFSLSLMFGLDQASDTVMKQFFRPLGWFIEDFEKRFDATSKRIENRAKSFESAFSIENALKRDLISFEDLSRAIKSWGDNLTGQQQRIKNQYDSLLERSQSMLMFLRETGQVSDSMSLDAFEVIAKDIAKTNLELEIYLELFQRIKDAQGPENILEKWIEEPSSANILTYIEDFIKEYEKFGGVISDVQLEELRGIERNRQAMIDSYQELMSRMPTPSDSREVWDRWIAEVRELRNKATEENANFSKNQLGQLILSFNAAKEELSRSLRETEERFKNSAETASREVDRIVNDHNIKVKGLFDNVAKQVGESSETLANEFKEDVNSMSKEFTKLETEAEKSWTNISKHSEDSVETQYKAIGDWLDTVQDRMNTFSVDMNSTLDSLGQALAMAFQAGDMEVFDQIGASIETATSEGLQYYEQMGESIDSVLDHLSGRENELLDNLEKYAQQALSIQQQVSDFISDLDQKQMDRREIFEDNRRKGEELYRQAVQKTAEAESATGENRNKLLKEANTLWTDYFNIGKQISGEIKNHDDIQKKIADSKQKIRDLDIEISRLNPIDNEKELERLTKQRTDELSNQKKLQDELNLSIEADSEARRIALQSEKGRLGITDELKQSAKDELDIIQSQIEKTEILKGKINEIVTALAEVNFDFNPQLALQVLEDVQSRLNDLSEPIELNFSFKEDGGIQSTLDNLGADIVKIGDTWTNTWDTSIENSNQKIQDFDEAINSLSDKNLNIEITGSGSETLPISKKIDSVKTMLSDIAKSVIEVTVNIVGLDKLRDLKNEIERLTRSTHIVNVVTRYSSTGTAPEGKQTGGRLPGFGGGDRIPLLAEAGEWIIRKEAVKKYGNALFASLNSLRLPRFRTGGYVAAPIKSNTESTSKFAVNLQDFGKVILDTGNMQIPAIVKTDVISELSNHLSKMRRFSS